MQPRLPGLLVAFATLALAPPAFADGDAAAGKQIFQRCGICHSPEKGVNRLGPSLFAVVGRPSASAPGYAYSDALKKLHLTWTPATIDKWLSGPQAMAPGTKMYFPGLPNAADRQNVIAYLETLK